MKFIKITLPVIICLILTSFTSNAQSTEGYTFHESSNGVSLYYKVSDYDVIFKAVNERDKAVYVKVYNVISTWSNGKTREKDVDINFVGAGRASNAGNLNTDNYAKLKTWKFSSWEWSSQAL